MKMQWCPLLVFTVISSHVRVDYNIGYYNLIAEISEIHGVFLSVEIDNYIYRIS